MGTKPAIGLRASPIAGLGLLIACVGQPPFPPAISGADLVDSTTTDGGTLTANQASSTESATEADPDSSGGETTEDTTGFPSVCGDSVTEGDEECDLGPQNGQGEYCTTECLANICGDGYLGPGEACDDGNQNNGDQCTTDCGLATCGDGALQPGEECDEGDNNSETGSCLPSCISASCGDLFVQAGIEACDGVNTGAETCASQGFDRGVLACQGDCSDFDTSNCHLCGNNIVEPNEVCDGNVFQAAVTCADFAPGGTTVSGGDLTCIASCTMIDSTACTFCGDDIVDAPTEECDGPSLGVITCESLAPPGTTASGGSPACSATCTAEVGTCTYCGDGVAEGSEECDDNDLAGATCMSLGFGNGNLGCTADCLFDTSSCDD